MRYPSSSGALSVWLGGALRLARMRYPSQAGAGYGSGTCNVPDYMNDIDGTDRGWEPFIIVNWRFLHLSGFLLSRKLTTFAPLKTLRR